MLRLNETKGVPKRRKKQVVEGSGASGGSEAVTAEAGMPGACEGGERVQKRKRGKQEPRKNNDT